MNHGQHFSVRNGTAVHVFDSYLDGDRYVVPLCGLRLTQPTNTSRQPVTCPRCRDRSKESS